MKKKCTFCIINEEKSKKILQENSRLNNLVSILNRELHDKTEWIEHIKGELSNIDIEAKTLKDTIFKLKKQVNKLA